MRRLLLVSLALAVLAAASPTDALADDGWRFRRTSPRVDLARDGPALVLGVPGGRAWGLESGLLPVPAAPTVIVADVEIADPLVREVFLRVAWYREATGRPRQMAIHDSAMARGPGRVPLALPLAPPPGAVAYRIRVLARLESDGAASAADGFTVEGLAAGGPGRPALTRLRP
ncbi:MAG TPA: hypothetical protein VMJ92_03465 [Candidatus Limnocylindrales bacterium]|nr:hypothetical protein [Candidatus Limnocylindrales bacterium]